MPGTRVWHSALETHCNADTALYTLSAHAATTWMLTVALSTVLSTDPSLFTTQCVHLTLVSCREDRICFETAIAGSFALIEIGRILSSPVLSIPMWIPYLSLPFGLTYFGFEFILAMAERLEHPSAERTPT